MAGHEILGSHHVRQQLVELLHGFQVGRTASLAEFPGPQQSLRNSVLGHVLGKRIVVAAKIEHLLRKAQFEPENEIHHQHRTLHLPQLPIHFGMHGIANNHQRRRTLLQRVEKSVLAQNRQQVVDPGMQVGNDNRGERRR
ncbi:MAG: hypothetical protein AW09_001345 [Candidatus Accumulibacter phosphatis]|uniref:Uncharacterized protein n=1 Tax=Candidatus Accumulibacter phosphatis TaxID=327160 RepID=A0A080M8E1_9PROT|nr:MAG: hypothetical protein AW09_001345 [Candidatus Accumulibacter phosphatis]